MAAVAYKYFDKFPKMLIAHMTDGLSYEAFAGLIEVARSTLYEWDKNHPEFLEAKKIGLSKSLIKWEKIGMAGLYMGGKDNPFNSTVWIFNMKNRFGWTDRQDVTTAGKEINLTINHPMAFDE